MARSTGPFIKLWWGLEKRWKIPLTALHVEREQQERAQLLDGMLVQARLLEPGPLKVYHDPTITKKVHSASSGKPNVRQVRGDDGDDLDTDHLR